jgi:hypothetical protein
MHLARHPWRPSRRLPAPFTSAIVDSDRPPFGTPITLDEAVRESGDGTRLVLIGAARSFARPHRILLIATSSMSFAPRVGSRIALLIALGASAACARSDASEVPASQRAAIADTLRGLLTNAYDLSKPGDAVARLMSLYPDSGRIISASGGRVTTSRDSLQAELRAFWENVGQNMRNPKWTWGPMHVDVLAPDAAVVTTTYTVPHLTPRGDPHVIAGAWTAVFKKRGGRWTILQEHLSDLPQAMPMPAAMDSSATMPMSHQH